MLSAFHEIAALLTLAALAGLLGLVLRQPLIVAFLAVGIVAGPAGVGLVQSHEHIGLLAELGVALLLFVVGLRLDLHLIRSVGAVAMATGLGQVLFTSVIGAGICLALGMDAMTSIYVGVALTFSSTIIIVKLLSDKRELDSLHGRIALGFLVVQDLVVVAALAVLSGMGFSAGGEPAADSGFQGPAVVALLALPVLAWVGADRLLPRLTRVPELLVTLCIAWAMLMAVLSDLAGLGKELGGLMAGVALSGSALRDTLAARLSGIREFLLLFFFISLGSYFDLSIISTQYVEGVLLSLFVLIGNPLIVMVIMGVMGFRKRTGFLAGLTVAQISEFSLVFIALGVSLGQVTGEALGLVTLVGMITIALSTYMIYYSHPLYARIEPWLGVFERKQVDVEPGAHAPAVRRAADAVVFGLGRYGSHISRELADKGWQILGVDFDPEAVKRLRESGIPAVLGDITDPDLCESIPLAGVRWAICTVPGWLTGPGAEDPRRGLIQLLMDAGFGGQLAATARTPGDTELLRAAGVRHILDPFEDAAERAAERLLDSDRRAH